MQILPISTRTSRWRAAFLPWMAGLLVIAVWVALAALRAGRGVFGWGVRNSVELLLTWGAGALLLLLPGLAVIDLFWHDHDLSLSERLAAAGCVGIALPPLLLELSSLVGLKWSSALVIGLIVVSAVYLGWRVLMLRRREGAFAWPKVTWTGLLLTGLLGLLALLRAYNTRGLAAGMWGDSYHHTLITRLLMDHGGLFDSWQPYAPLATFSYHFGFHANAAFFAWLSGLPAQLAVVAAGNLAEIAAVGGVYLLATRITRSPAAGVGAAALAGFLNLQPGFYFNWGRYTQLAAQALLPMVVLAWIDLGEAKTFSPARVVFAALLTAALALTHYFVLAFAGLLVAIVWMFRLLREPSFRRLGRLAGRGSAALGLALLFYTPWLVRIFEGNLTLILGGFVNGGVSADRIAQITSIPALVPFYITRPVLLFAVLGLLIAVALRNWELVAMAVWADGMLLLSMPGVLGLPGSGVIDTFTVAIALYLPAAVLGGAALGWLASTLGRWRPALAAPAVIALVIGISAWGSGLQANMFSVDYQLLREGDARAMDWIRTNTPAEARFIVNTFPAYGGTLLAGPDGGLWIPLLAGRQTNLPPMTYGSERGEQADFSSRINHLAATLRGQPLTVLAGQRVDLSRPEALAVLRANGYGFIYLDDHSNPPRGTADWIDPQPLRDHPDQFRLLYDQGGVMIFALEPALQ